MKRALIRIGAIAAVLVVQSAPSSAAIVTWTMTGHLNVAQSTVRSGFVDYPDVCCGEYTNIQHTTTDATLAGLDAEIGDPFTLTYTFDTSVAPTDDSSDPNDFPPYNSQIRHQLWSGVAGRGASSASINGQVWSGAVNSAELFSYQFRNASDPSQDYVSESLHASAYFAQGDYIHQQTLSDGSPYGPFHINYTDGFTFADPSNLGSVIGDPDGWTTEYYMSLNFYRGVTSPLVPALLLNGWPTTIDLSDYPLSSSSGQFVEWSSRSASDLVCGVRSARPDGPNGSNPYTYCYFETQTSYIVQGTIDSLTVSVSGVPAPSALALLGLGFIGVGVRRRMRL